ncbi:MAG: efflux RND transporter periplasmic adaptor subunit [Acidiferrobacterales bacterium]
MNLKLYLPPYRFWIGTVMLALLIPLAAPADDGILVVKDAPFPGALKAYAQVRSIQVLSVQTLVTGQVEGLRVLPGQHVKAGQVLARLRGIAQSSQVAAAMAAAAQARAALNLARQNYAGIEKTYPDISTRQQLETAMAAVKDAQARLAAAGARRTLIQGGGLVRAPSNGTVLSLAATTGQNLNAGSPLLVLQPDHGLWLRADFYGNAIRQVSAGMKGKFLPADGGVAIPVRVRSVINEVESNGGRSVGCVPIGRVDWIAGEAGTLVLEGDARSWPALPSQALILDAGRWWVVIRENGRYRNQPVTVGPEEAGWSAITRGLKAGQQVLVTHAYRVYHRDFARNYQQPD